MQICFRKCDFLASLYLATDLTQFYDKIYFTNKKLEKVPNNSTQSSPKYLIRQRLQTDIGRSVRVNTTIHLVFGNQYKFLHEVYINFLQIIILEYNFIFAGDIFAIQLQMVQTGRQHHTVYLRSLTDQYTHAFVVGKNEERQRQGAVEKRVRCHVGRVPESSRSSTWYISGTEVQVVR